MDVMTWDFSKLPDSELPGIEKMLKAKDIVGLIKVHDKYNLSPYPYCCSAPDGVLNWFQDYINKKRKSNAPVSINIGINRGSGKN